MMTLKALNYQNFNANNKKIIKNKAFLNDVIFKKYLVSEEDIIKLDENQLVFLVQNGKILDMQENVGFYEIEKSLLLKKNYIEELKGILIPHSENQDLCIVFLNTKPVLNNRYLIEKPIKYNSYENGKLEKVYIKFKGNYTLNIEEPKIFITRVIGLRSVYTKQELIEKIRDYILNSIIFGMNEISEMLHYNVNELVEKSKDVEEILKVNEFDKKLDEFGVRISYFDINEVIVCK